MGLVIKPSTTLQTVTLMGNFSSSVTAFDERLTGTNPDTQEPIYQYIPVDVTEVKCTNYSILPTITITKNANQVTFSGKYGDEVLLNQRYVWYKNMDSVGVKAPIQSRGGGEVQPPFFAIVEFQPDTTPSYVVRYELTTAIGKATVSQTVNNSFDLAKYAFEQKVLTSESYAKYKEIMDDLNNKETDK